MSLELVSFKLCPFVQRSIITLLYKNVPFKLTHIDMSSPPDWFKQRSPFGKVPILIINDKHVVFESAVINEYLDESTPGSLLPDDVLQRALDRSWIDYGSAMIMDLSGLMHADTGEKYDNNYAALVDKLHWLENILPGGDFFNGNEISLVDFAYAPLFMRIQLIGLDKELLNCPKINHWSKTLLSLPQVQKSVVENFPDLLKAMIIKNGVYTAKQLKLS